MLHPAAPARGTGAWAVWEDLLPENLFFMNAEVRSASCRVRPVLMSRFASGAKGLRFHIPRNFNNPYTRNAGQRIALMTPRIPPRMLVAVVR